MDIQCKFLNKMNKKKRKKNTKKIARLSLVIFVLAILLGSGIYFYYTLEIDKKVFESVNKKIEHLTKRCEYTRKIDGMCVGKKSQENIWPVAVMIDNHPGAWPQLGVAQADVAYNFLVEGWTTRVMAIFAKKELPKKIGPVRSARPYFVQMVEEIDALYMHAGGSPDALKKIEEDNVHDLNEITSYGPLYFDRDYTKDAPHNLFTSGEQILQARKDYELTENVPTYRPWHFDEKNINFLNEDLQEVFINYGPGEFFDIRYKYDEENKIYLREQNNNKYVDGLTGEQVQVKNIVVQFIDPEVVLDNYGRLELKMIGQGDAYIIFDGKIIKGVWNKEKNNTRTIFYDSEGKEIYFKPGNIWIEVVPTNKQVQIK
jgi:hypothetical protein